MKNFRVIPVLDILKKQAVHAIKGERNKYLPIKSIIADSANPIELIKAYHRIFNFSEVYIADLDLIQNRELDEDLLKSIQKQSELEIMIDVGVRNIDDIIQVKKFGFHHLIFGLETIDSLEVIKQGIEMVGMDSVVVSIDMKDKVLLSKNVELSKMTIMNLVDELWKMKVKEIILLDLARVGAKSGCYDDLYGEIRERFPNLSILVGGGARDINDLKLLKQKKMDGVLIASALHDGSITKKDLKYI